MYTSDRSERGSNDSNPTPGSGVSWRTHPRDAMIWFGQGRLVWPTSSSNTVGQGDRLTGVGRNLDVSNRSAENVQDVQKCAVRNGEPEGVGSDFSQTTMFSNR